MNGLVQDARDFNTLAEFLARRDVPQMSAAALQQAIGAPRAEMVLLFGGSLPEGCRLAGQLWQAGLARKVMTIGGVGHTTAAFLERFESALPAGHSANLTAYLDVTPGRLLAGTAAVYLAVRLLLGLLGRPGRPAVPAVLEVAGAQVGVLAFFDSGFTLADPVSGRAVVLVRYDAVRPALPEAARAALDSALAGGDALPDPSLGLRYLVCGTIAGRTLLPALPAAALTRRAGGRLWREKGLLAAFCPGGADEGWTLLLGADLAGRMGL